VTPHLAHIVPARAFTKQERAEFVALLKQRLSAACAP
jgi:hypothetical protein